MEFFMRNIPYTADRTKVTLCLERELHAPLFEPYATTLPINFNVFLYPDRQRRDRHSGCGILTLPSEAIGAIFLDHFVSSFRKRWAGSLRKVSVDNRVISFEKSNKPLRTDVLSEIQRLPYRDPRAIREKEQRLANLSGEVDLRDVQFAWLCRDETISIEWQWNLPCGVGNLSHHLRFNDGTRRELIVERQEDTTKFRIAIRYSRIQSIETDSSSDYVILLTLDTPPSFEKSNIASEKRQKLTYLNASHAAIGPFTWQILRLVCISLSDLAEFKRMAEVADLKVRDQRYVAERKGLFSPHKLGLMQEWVRVLNWSVAFQCESLHRDSLLDTVELLHLRSHIQQLVNTRGPEHTTQVLRQFGLHLRSLWSNQDEETVQSCFDRAEEVVQQSGPSTLTVTADQGIFQCLHVHFTPTGMTLSGPFPDTSNRILRRYPDHHDSFLRVTFTDEERLKFRFDHREVDGPGFIDTRVGTILRDGFKLCGRK